ncbi:MAG: reprolysin-like metallopeptidase, partial [Cyanobacteria bacterium J06598_3]
SSEFNNGRGRADTIAHEIGHNLGLRHATFGAGAPNNLLTDGDDRNIPTSVADVGADGAGLSRLTDAQIKEILNSPFVNRGNPGVLGQEIEAADHIHTHPHIHTHTHIHNSPHTHTPTHTQAHPPLSADEAFALLTRLAVLGRLDGIDPTLITQADIALLRSNAAAAKSVPEPVSVLPLGVLSLLLIGVRRYSSRPLAGGSGATDKPQF